MLRLLIARHGNTFDKGDMLLRVGKKTDLPLSTSGQLQAEKLGQYLKQHHANVSQVYTSNLQRTQQTANIALAQMHISPQQAVCDFLDEIDYGPDEGKPEEEVIARLGKEVLGQWEAQAIVPPGWHIDSQQVINAWQHFAKDLVQQHTTPTTILVVTSNGIARFAPYITGDFDNFAQQNNIKLATGALASLNFNNNAWHVDGWNIRP